MKLSVIVPAYNEESMIGDTLACVRAAVAPHELFVVNHYSTDGTAEIAARYAYVLTPSETMTRGAALNYAASVATGDVLLFLHADTRLPIDAATSIQAALDNPRVIGGAFQLRLDDPGWAARLISRSVNLRSSLLHIFFGDQAMFVRHEVFARVGGYQDWSVMEDLEILGRLQRFGQLKILDTEVVTSARRHRSNGWLKTIATIWMMSLLTRLGVPGQVMIRLYKPHR
jgi:rSAM/selenodomain-associated transferase 2